MTITANAYEVAALLVAIAFLVLVIMLIPTLMQARKTIRAVEELTLESKKTVENLNFIIKKAGEQAGGVEDVVIKLTEVGNKLAVLANLVVETIKNPLITALSMFLGIEYGLKKFFKKDEKGGGDNDDKQ